MILAALGRQLPASALLLVQPATILGWHRALVRRGWAAFGRRGGPGRPSLPAECQELVLRLARENPLWGYVRIRGELLKLGHRVSTTSIRKLLRRHRIPPAPRRAGITWRRFLRTHGKAILACDCFRWTPSSSSARTSSSSWSWPAGASSSPPAASTPAMAGPSSRRATWPGSSRRRSWPNTGSTTTSSGPIAGLELRPPRAPTPPSAVAGPVIRRTLVDRLINEHSRLAA